VQNNSTFLELVAKQVNNSTFLDSIVNFKKINKTLITLHFYLKMTMTATKIDSSHESGKNFITWAWPASTTIIYNNLYKV
jgi:hypothetical protein